MCTLSWFLTDQGYELFFTRDEQQTRSRAIPPSIDSVKDSIYPIDPDGKGTWIALHRSGMALCILNEYQSHSPNQPLISRGKLILDLIDKPDVSIQLKSTDLQHYAPFKLCLFPAALNLNNPIAVQAFVWNGDTLSTIQQNAPAMSSAVTWKEVQKDRLASWNILAKQPDRTSLFNFHRSHQPKKGKGSVCMHRNDASSQSLSHLVVAKNTRDFYYYDGPPCETDDFVVAKF